MNRQTPFSTIGQQSFMQDPLQQFQQQVGQPGMASQLMQDYSQLRNDVNQLQAPASQRRPQSRELDLMNLLLVGSMDKGKQKSGLEGLGGLIGVDQESRQYQQQPQPQYYQPPPPQYYQQPPQQYYQPPPQYDQSISPATHMKSAGQLIVNGQMGLNVDQHKPQQQEMNTDPSQNRILAYVARQNEVLEQLTTKMQQQRDVQSLDDKKKLTQRMKALEAINEQDAYYNEMQDEVPSHQRRYVQNQPGIKHVYQPQFGGYSNYGYPYQYQPYQQPYGNPYNQYPQYPGYIQPPPQPKQSKQDTLQMLLLMKQLQMGKNKQQRKGKRKQRGDEYINDEGAMDSFTSESSQESVEIVQKPRIMRPRPIPPPPPYDPSADQDKLLQLKGERGRINLQRLIHLILYGRSLRTHLYELIQANKNDIRDNMPQYIAEFVQETETLIIKVSKNALEQLLKTPKLNMQIVPINNKPIKPAQIKQNIIKLKEILKLVMDAIVDNSSGLPEGMLFFLARVSNNYQHLMDNYFVKFETNRLTYTMQGSLKDMNQNKAFMMYCTNVWIKLIVYRVFAKCWTQVQGIQVTDQMKINIKTLCSVMYEIVMMFVRGYCAIQPDNFKHVAMENKVKERKEFYYKIDGFEPTEDEVIKLQEAQQEKYDEPLLFPVYTARQMSEFFDNERIFVNTMMALVEGWCEKVHDQVSEYFKVKQAEVLNEAKDRRAHQTQQYGMRKDRVNQLVKQRKEQYIGRSKEIEDLKKRIKEETARYEADKAAYDQKQQQRNQRKSVLR